MATLIVLGQPAAGTRCVIQDHRHVVLGRDPTCDLTLSRKSISRFHAQILANHGHFFLEDMQSTNGTFLNGEQVRGKVPLTNGDRICLHDVPMVFFESDAVPQSDELTDLIEPVDELHVRQTQLDLAVDSILPARFSDLQGRLQSLVEITRDLGSSLEIEVILPRVLDLLFRMFPQAEIGEIHLADRSGRLSPVAMKHGRDADSTDLTAAPFSLALIDQVFQTGQGVLHTDEAPSANLALEQYFQSTICVPILSPTGPPLGVILLESDDSSREFTEGDLEVFSAVGVLAGQAMSYSHAHQIVVEHSSTLRQLETARQIQLGMLPQARPDVPGYAFADYYSAAERVGGDYYFYEALRDGRVIVGIADASGKGLSAALNIARFAGEVRLRIATSPTLKSAVAELNRFVMSNADECLFITSCICVLDPRRHSVTVANAGHPSPLLKRPGGTVKSVANRQRSLPLGISPDFDVHPITVAVSPGDQLLLFTDGVFEAMNKRNELFGNRRLQGDVSQHSNGLESLIADLVKRIDHFREGRTPSDDMAIVGFERLPGEHVPGEHGAAAIQESPW